MNLVNEGPHRLHRERVMDLVWPELAKKAASNNLRQTLHVARKTLHPDPEINSRYLNLSGEQLLMCPQGSLWVDVDVFEAAADTALRSKNPAACRVAIELYSGELLPEDRYEEWAESRRQELRHTWLSLHLELARKHVMEWVRTFSSNVHYDIISKGEKVGVRMTQSGTHTGTIRGIPPLASVSRSTMSTGFVWRTGRSWSYRP